MDTIKNFNYSPSLLTYEQIVDMATNEGYSRTNTIAELNTNSEAYYNMLYDGGNYVHNGYDGNDYIDNITHYVSDEYYAISYNSNNNSWYVIHGYLP